MERPNILYLHSHDSGRYVQPYGFAIPTPHMQSLAEQGVTFRQAFCVGPTCSPSRAGLVTGMCAHSSGMIGLAHRNFCLKDYRQHWVNTLRDYGYHSVLVGVQHVAPKAEMIGYDEIVPTASTLAKDVGPKAARWLRNRPQEPFFLAVGMSDTHREFDEPGPQEDERYCRPPAPIADTPETRHDMACYKASARALDDGFGQVLDALDANPALRENTLVICTTDHGIAFPAMKCNLTDHGIGVMLMMRGPGGFTGGKVCDALISQMDIFPTVCDLLNIAVPTWVEGRSFMPVIRGDEDEVNDQVVADVTYHAAYEPMRCVRTKRWKYIRRFGGRPTPVLVNCDPSVSKDLWMEHGWQEREVDKEELYDVIYDPNETRNVARVAENRGVLRNMRERMDRWMRETDDPLLLSEQVPAPVGALVNSPNNISHREPPYVVQEDGSLVRSERRNQ